MSRSNRNGVDPRVSIILPTYNRSHFLRSAFASIEGQAFRDWELIVIDDGSTDDTRALVTELTRGWTQSVRYVYQENQGAYGARNTGLDLVRGPFIAFYDSDDLWLSHHLRDCVAGLEANPEVDWVYGATRTVDFASGNVLDASSFYVEGRPQPFLKLGIRVRGSLRIIEDDRAVQYMLVHGLYSGLQCSVIRRNVFEDYRFEAVTRNEAEDQLIVVKALADGHRLGYFDAVHVVYHIHTDNSSSCAASQPTDKHERLFRKLADGFERLRQRVPLNTAQTRALNMRLGGVYFWMLGYNLLPHPAFRAEAWENMRRGLRLWPWDSRCWKTYALALLRARLDTVVEARSSTTVTHV